jgi:DNA-binding CsgD family transcriptional regulator
MTTDATTIRTLGFTPRQAEVLSLALQGRTSAGIAYVLTISPRTVEKHLEAIYDRLGVVNRAGAVMATVTALESAGRAHYDVAAQWGPT